MKKVSFITTVVLGILILAVWAGQFTQCTHSSSENEKTAKEKDDANTANANKIYSRQLAQGFL
jgi:hypothetical protein